MEGLVFVLVQLLLKLWEGSFTAVSNHKSVFQAVHILGPLLRVVRPPLGRPIIYTFAQDDSLEIHSSYFGEFFCKCKAD